MRPNTNPSARAADNSKTNSMFVSSLGVSQLNSSQVTEQLIVCTSRRIPALVTKLATFCDFCGSLLRVDSGKAKGRPVAAPFARGQRQPETIRMIGRSYCFRLALGAVTSCASGVLPPERLAPGTLPYAYDAAGARHLIVGLRFDTLLSRNHG